MRLYEFVVVYRSNPITNGDCPNVVEDVYQCEHKTVRARSEHLARRQLLKSYLGRNYQVKEITKEIEV